MSWLRRVFGKEKQGNKPVAPLQNQLDEDFVKALVAEAGEAFVLQVDIIPDALIARTFNHDVDWPDGPVQCTTYLSKGLVEVGHPEIRFTIKRAPDETPRQEPFMLFRNIHQQAQAGNIVEAYQITWFGEDVMGFRGIVYATPTPMPGINTPSDVLAGHFIKAKEVEEYHATVPLRVLTRIGRHYWYYPWPPFSDPDRPDLGEGTPSDEGLLGKLGRIWAGAAYVSRKRRRVTLTIPPVYAPTLEEELEKVPQDAAFALITGLDPAAQACHIWRSGQKDPEAISAYLKEPVGSQQVESEDDALRVAGAFMAFVPGQDANDIRAVEDGFAALLTDLDWQRVKHAIIAGESALVQPPGDSFELAVEWRESEYYNPIDNVTCVADWTKYEPADSDTAEGRDPRFDISFRFLTSESDVASRIEVKALTDFLIAAEKHATSLLKGHDGAGSLVAQFDCDTETQTVRVAYQGEIPSGLVQQIETELGWMEKLHPTGPLSFQLEMDIAAKTEG